MQGVWSDRKGKKKGGSVKVRVQGGAIVKLSKVSFGSRKLRISPIESNIKKKYLEGCSQ